MPKNKKSDPRGAGAPESGMGTSIVKPILIVIFMLCALATFGAFAGRRSPSSRTAVVTTAPAPLPAGPQYAANSPAKEYIYAGGKLLAVSEPPIPADLAIWRPTSGAWWVMGATGGVTQQWGANGDEPVPGDYS